MRNHEPQQPPKVGGSELNVQLCCPFCGKAPIFPDAKDVFGTCYEAGCEECGIPSISIQIIDCFGHPRDHVHDSWDNETMQYGIEYIEVARREAIERWNTRAGHNAKYTPKQVHTGLKMSRELIENLREYADIAEAGDKSHWALAMRQAAEYIKADLEKPLPERVKLNEKMLEHFTCKKVERKFEGVEEPLALYYTKMWAPPTYQLYENEAAALWHNLGKALGYAEPPAKEPLSDNYFLSQVLNEGDGTYRP